MSFPFGRLWSRPSPIPYHAALDTPLLRFGFNDLWRISDASRGTLIVGGTSAGKTSGSANSIARAFLKSGMGFLVLCAKENHARNFVKVAKQAGRGRDIIRMDSSGTHRFNVMDYVAATSRAGFDQNLSVALLAAAEASRVAKPSSGGGENPFFRDAAEELLLHALPILKVARGGLRLRELMQFIDSAPTTSEQSKSREWLTRSFCGQTLMRCGDLADAGNSEAERIVEEHVDYFLIRHAALGDRTRSSIVATLTATISGLLSGKVNELLGTYTTFTPEHSHEGAIIVLDLSVHEFGPVGAIVQTVFKSLWMQAIQRRKIEPGKMRFSALWIDECQYFINSQDAEFLSTSRECGACPVYISQDLPTFFSAIGGDNAENEGKRFIAKCQNLLFHANTDHVTNSYASAIIGRVEKHRMTRGTNRGVSNSKSDDAGVHSGGGQSQGESRNYETYEDDAMRPEAFGNELRTGGKSSGFKVDAMMIRSSHKWRSTGRNYAKVTFHQKAR